MSKFVRVCKFSDLKSGGMKTIDVEGEQIVVVREGENVYALKDECTHEEYALSEGWVEDNCIHCAFHGAKFSLANGEALSLPAYEDVQTFPTRIVDGVIQVEIP